MPLPVKSVVGSLPGMSEEDGTGMCARALKNSRYLVRTSLMFIGIKYRDYEKKESLFNPRVRFQQSHVKFVDSQDLE